MTPLSARPIGVFDSGVGGLSVLRALWSELPAEDYVYVADAGHAPYGEKDDSFVLCRAQDIADGLLREHDIKALVVACNTATAAAITHLRATYPHLPIVGIEPAVKPALTASRTGHVGVMATRGTLQSEKFRNLMGSLPSSSTVVLQPCDGLADAIERNDAPKIEALCAHYTRAIGQFGPQAGACDTLVLGCTHYPFAESILRNLCGPDVQFLEGGAPVARRTRQLLASNDVLQTETDRIGSTLFQTSGRSEALADALQRWLDVRLDCQQSAPNPPVARPDWTHYPNNSETVRTR